MKECARHLEGLVAVALGEGDPEAETHAEACPACRAKLGQLRDVVLALGTPVFDAPERAMRAARELMGVETPPTAAVLVSSSLGLAGARRGAPESFQCVFEGGGVRVRLMYVRRAGVWHVAGKAEGSGVRIAEAAGGEHELDDEGRFEFAVRTLAETEVRLLGAGTNVLVPPPGEAA